MMAGKWLKWELRSGTYEVHGKQVGIVGLGKIGRKVARLLQGFDASLVYYDVFRLPEAEEKRLGVTYRELDDLLATSDVVTLHVPSIPATVGMIGRRELGLMKPTATLVNTCRGAVVDEEALIETLREGKIRGAALDAFVKEPLPAGHPLLSLPNVILTPHAGGANEDATLEGVLHAYRNIVKVSRGEPLDAVDIGEQAGGLAGVAQPYRTRSRSAGQRFALEVENADPRYSVPGFEARRRTGTKRPRRVHSPGPFPFSSTAAAA